MCASKLQYVCISAPTSGLEACPRLWPSSLTKTLHIMYSLLCRLRPLCIDRDSSVREPRKYCRLCTKKMVNHFSESLTFTSAMIYRNEVRTKHLRMLIFYSAIDNLRRSDEQSFYSGRAHLLKTRDNALSNKIIHHLISLLNNYFLRFFFRLLVTACNERYFCLESACQAAIT